MANFYGAARTNAFSVKPELFEEFKAYMKRLSVTVLSEEPTRVVLLSEDESGWPSYDPVAEERDGDGSSAFEDQVSRFLSPGSVAVMMEVGNEKMKYLHGYAIAVDSTGKVVYVNLHKEIQRLVKETWPDVHYTEPSYEG